MKRLRFSASSPVILFSVACLLLPVIPLSAQTLYVPSGTSGIGSSSSNVGIGTSSPGSYLPGVVGATIYGNYPALSLSGSESGGNFFLLYENAGSFRVYSNNGTADRLTIAAAGNVGIGTASPGAKLEVIGGANPFGLIVEGDGSSANARIALRRGNDTAATGNIDWIGNTNAVGARIGVNDDVAGSMAFKLGGSAAANTRLFISSAGNVGIGTTNPNTRLYVKGSLGIERSDSTDYSTIDNEGNLDYNARNSYNHVWQIGGSEKMRLDTNGNLGLGTTSPSHKLAVNGTIRAKDVIVDTGWSDYVFKPDYQLAPLSEVEAHIKAHGHLPGVPSEAQVAKEGVSMGAMQSKLLAKIEELTLHMIALEKRTHVLEAENIQLKSQH